MSRIRYTVPSTNWFLLSMFFQVSPPQFDITYYIYLYILYIFKYTMFTYLFRATIAWNNSEIKHISIILILDQTHKLTHLCFLRQLIIKLSPTLTKVWIKFNAASVRQYARPAGARWRKTHLRGAVTCYPSLWWRSSK